MKKVIAALVILAAASAAGYFAHALWLPFALLPVWLIPLIKAVRTPSIDPVKLEEIKTLPSRPPSENAISLNDRWQFRIKGIVNGEIKLPSDLAVLSKFADIKGTLEFRKVVKDIPPAADKRMILCCGGTGGPTRVTANGESTGQEMPGFVPFEIDVTDYIQGGDLDLRIEVDQSTDNRIPGRLKGFAPPYGLGIFRDIYLEPRERVRIKRAWLEKDAAAAILLVEVASDLNAPVAVGVEIRSPGEKKAVFRNEQLVSPFTGRKILSYHLPPDAIKEWRPETPSVYNIKVMAICEDVRLKKEFTTGVSSTKITAEEITAGGELLKLRGLIRCEHYPPYGAAIPNWSISKDIQGLKETGLNLFYTPEYPPHPDTLGECDKAGIFIVSEFPYNYLSTHIGPERTDEILKRESRRAATHPSFLFWVLPEGCRGPDAGEGLEVPAVYEGDISEEHDDFRVMKVNVDLYRHDGTYGKLFSNFDNPGMLVFDTIDTEGGREDRNNRELRKAGKDLIYLRAAERQGINAFVCGQFFTWGVRAGVTSINRKKKASASAIKSYLETKRDNEITWNFMPLKLKYRIVLMALASTLLALAFIPHWSIFFFTFPPAYVLSQPVWHALSLFLLTALITPGSLVMLFEWDRRILHAAAPLLGYPLFMKLHTNYHFRTGVIFAATLYLTILGCAFLCVISSGGFVECAMPVILASCFELFFMVYLLAFANPIYVFSSVAIMTFSFLLWFFNPLAAAGFVLIKYAPPLACAVFLTKNDPFKT